MPHKRLREQGLLLRVGATDGGMQATPDAGARNTHISTPTPTQAEKGHKILPGKKTKMGHNHK